MPLYVRQRSGDGAETLTLRCIRDHVTVGRIHLDGVLVDGPRRTEVAVGIARDDTNQMLLDVQLASSFVLRDSIARALETSLLPPPLPDLLGFTVDANYRASEGVSTGDFYSLFPLAGDDWGLDIGDVGGHGTVAAAITTAIRYTLRGAAQVDKHPTRVIAVANEAHFSAAGEERFTTAHYVRIHRRAQDVELPGRHCRSPSATDRPNRLLGRGTVRQRSDARPHPIGNVLRASGQP